MEGREVGNCGRWEGSLRQLVQLESTIIYHFLISYSPMVPPHPPVDYYAVQSPARSGRKLASVKS